MSTEVLDLAQKVADPSAWLYVRGAELDFVLDANDDWGPNYASIRVHINEPDDDVRLHYDVDSVIAGIRKVVVERLALEGRNLQLTLLHTDCTALR